MGGGVAIPDVPVKVVVSPAEGDNGPRIQAAIDLVARQPADARGIRGAVLLLAGRHEVGGSLRIATGGVVLRGQGDGPGGTVLVAKGTDRRPLIRIKGMEDRRIVSETPLRVADDYVPVGAERIRVADIGGLRVGDTVLVRRPSTAAWIASLGMDRFAPGDEGRLSELAAGEDGPPLRPRRHRHRRRNDHARRPLDHGPRCVPRCGDGRRV